MPQNFNFWNLVKKVLFAVFHASKLFGFLILLTSSEKVYSASTINTTFGEKAEFLSNNTFVYCNYENMKNLLEILTKEYPDHAHLYSIGKSVKSE